MNTKIGAISVFLCVLSRSAAASPSCEFLNPVQFTGDTTLGEGCQTLTLGAGVTITVAAATNVTITAASIVVSGNGSATIVGVGTQGAGGSQGADGDSYPYWTSSNGTQYWNAVGDANRDPNNGCHGRQGGSGGQGATGPTITLTSSPTVAGTLELQSQGGPGGAGGRGGRGTTLRNVEGFTRNGNLYGCHNGGTGSTGAPGNPGFIINGVQRSKGSLTLSGGTKAKKAR